MFIGLTVGSTVLILIYLLFSIHIYKKNEGVRFTFRNTFPFEIFQRKKETFFLNLVLFLGLALLFINQVIFAITFYSSYLIILSLIMGVSTFTLGAIFVLPLTKLREHCICAILFLISIFAIAALNLVYDVKFFRLENNYAFLISIIADSIAVIISIIPFLNPKFTNLNFEIDESGNSVRPKTIHMALGEWAGVIALVLTQISIIVYSVI